MRLLAIQCNKIGKVWWYLRVFPVLCAICQLCLLSIYYQSVTVYILFRSKSKTSGHSNLISLHINTAVRSVMPVDFDNKLLSVIPWENTTTKWSSFQKNNDTLGNVNGLSGVKQLSFSTWTDSGWFYVAVIHLSNLVI